jgi:hypothetical protein
MLAIMNEILGTFRHVPILPPRAIYGNFTAAKLSVAAYVTLARKTTCLKRKRLKFFNPNILRRLNAVKPFRATSRVRWLTSE